VDKLSSSFYSYFSYFFTQVLHPGHSCRAGLLNMPAYKLVAVSQKILTAFLISAAMLLVLMPQGQSPQAAPLTAGQVTFSFTGAGLPGSAVLDSITVDTGLGPKTYSALIVPDGVAYQFANPAADQQSLRTTGEVAGANIMDGPAIFNPALIAANADRDITHYLVLKNQTTHTDFIKFIYNTPVISADIGYIIITERGGNNSMSAVVLDATGNPIGNTVEAVGGSGSYIDSGIPIITTQNAEIAVFPLSDLVPAGTAIHGIRYTYTGTAATGETNPGDGGDGKIFLIVDAVAFPDPVVTIDAPPVANIANQTAYPVTGTCTAGDSDVTVIINGVTPQTVLCSGAGTWSANFDVTPVPDGTDTIVINASQTNAIGAVGNALQVTADKVSTAPAIPTVVSQTTNNTTPTITGTATVVPGESFSVTVNGVSYPETGTDLTLTATSWSLVIPAGNTISDGTHNVTATVVDAAGNSISDATTRELIIDTGAGAPVVPTVISQTANNNTPTITGTATVTPGETFSVTVNGVSYPETGPDLTLIGTDWSLVIPVGNTIPDGTYDVTATVIDAAGIVRNDPTNGELIVDITTSVLLTKSTRKRYVSIGDFVSYTITVENQTSGLITPFTIKDTIPPGFKYVKGSAMVDSVKQEPEGQRPIEWTQLTLQPKGKITITYLLVVGTGVAEENTYKNRAITLSGITGDSISNKATAEVQVVGEAIFSRSLVIGKVFNDINEDGVQQEGEAGIANVRIASVSGSTVRTDAHGRYHIDDIKVKRFTRGRHFILKTDPSTLPPKSAFTTENPRVIRLTQGLVQKINFGVKLPIIDTTAPAVPTVVSQTTKNNTPTITGTATLAPDETLSVTVNGISYPEIGPDLSLTGTSWSLVIPKSNTIPDGTHNVTATVVDAAGNSSSDPTSGELIIDTVAPAVPIVVSQTTNNNAPTITGTATVAAGETFSVTVNGVTYPESDPDLTLTGTSWSLVIPAGNTIPDGTHNVTATVTDAAGNSSSDATNGELIIDTVAPAVPIVVSQTTSKTTPTITGTATVAAGETISVTVNGVTYPESDPDLTLTGTSWSLVIPVGNTIPDGTYDVTATVVDAAGNSSSDATNSELIITTGGAGAPAMIPAVVIPTITDLATVAPGGTFSLTFEGVNFDTDQSDVKPQMHLILDRVVVLLKKNPSLKLEIQGHTDTVMSAAYNKKLSMRRAISVMAYLVSRGIEPQRLSAQGYGFDKPIASNETKEGRAKNRRTELKPVPNGVEKDSLKVLPKLPTEKPQSSIRFFDGLKKLFSDLGDFLVGTTYAAGIEDIEMLTDRKQALATDENVWLTVDVLDVKKVLNIYLQNEPVLLKEEGLQDHAKFFIYSNYSDFIKRWELEIFSPEAEKSIATLSGESKDMLSPITWDLKDGTGQIVEPGRGYYYILTVYGLSEDENFDRTEPRGFEIVRKTLLEETEQVMLATEALPRETGLIKGEDKAEQLPYDRDNTYEGNIAITGGVVTIYGEGIPEDAQIAIDGHQVSVDRNGKFAREFIKAPGEHEFDVTISRSEGEKYHRKIPAIVKEEDFFMVGIADITVGKMSFKGHIEPVSGVDEYDENIYADGRLAFYLKGKIKGKYLLTAQLDTLDGPIKDIFSRLNKKDPRTIFRRFDPDQYYPVYGDDSVTTNEVNTQGRFYVKLEWDKSKVLWGNFRTDMNDTDISSYNRSLYGAKASLESTATTQFKDNRSKGSLFWAEAQTLHTRDEMRATGGSLYYLKHADIVIGSEQIQIEVRDTASGKVTGSYPLEIGRDYEMDWLQGRIILSRTLNSVISSKEIITNTPLAGENVYLVADYEFDARHDVIKQASYGARASHWLFDRFRIGGSFVNETRDTAKDYQFYGLDSTIKFTKGTYLTGEWGESQRTQSGTFFSNDGGLTYIELPAVDSDRKSEAWKVGLNMDISEWSDRMPDLNLSSFYLFREKGYSTSGQEALNDTQQYDIELKGHFLDSYSILSRYSVQDEENATTISTAMFQLGKEITEKLKLAGEVRAQRITDPGEKDLKDTLGAARLDYQFSDDVSLFASQQFTLSRSSGTPKNDRTTLGAGLDITKKIHIDAEGSTGDLGESAKLGGRYKFSKAHELYGNIQHDSGKYIGRSTRTTVGNKGKVSSKVDVYTEHQIAYGTYENSLSDIFGLNYAPVERWMLSVDYGRSSVNKRGERPSHRYINSGLSDNTIPGSRLTGFGARGPGTINRDVITGAVAYHSHSIRYRTKAQARFDRGTKDSEQYVLTNYLDWDFRHNMSLLLAFDYSITQTENSKIDDARFIEGKLGIAYRPIYTDRLNLLGKYTFIDDLSPLGQPRGTSPDERAHIFSVEGMYDVTKKWQVGEKFAYKRAEIRIDRDRGNWLSSDTYLWVNRVNYHFIRKWDALAEYRMLWNTLADDKKNGFLTALYRHIGKHVKLGVGYNFTDFDDNLTHLDYEAQGPFINLIGKW